MTKDNKWHKFRMNDSDRWETASVRAAAEGTNMSVLLRQWVDDYAAGGVSVKPARIGVSAAEAESVREALAVLDIGNVVVDTINKER